MTPADGNYFVYLPEARPHGICPCVATAAGFTRIPPGAAYPPQRHPLDHHLSWSNGRVLHAYQVVYVTHGGGTFESGPSRKRHRIQPGTLFLLFPGVWHRYAPDIKTGWTEHWLEFNGPAAHKARELGVIRTERPVLRVGLNRDLIDAFDLCHRWAQRAAPGRAAALATLALHLLALLETAEDASQPLTRLDGVVQRAQSLIAERFQERLDMRELADSLCVGYSNLRQNFKARTGMSLKQYHVQIRFQHAQSLLANTDKSVKEIADLLGFDSPYHFSAQFKSRTGLAPHFWRAQPARGRVARGG